MAVLLVQFVAGGKGEGKTKKMLEIANADMKRTDGHLVFIDDDRRHMFDLHYDIRFVETGKQLLSNYREFVGFILGILSQDSDIKHIYVDGVTNIIENIDNEALVKLKKRLSEISEQSAVDFVLCINWDKNILPEEIKEVLI